MMVGVYDFWNAYAVAPADANVEVQSLGSRVIVSLHVQGKSPVSLAVRGDEARAFADVMTRAIERFPDQPSTANLPDLILSLRLFADRLENA